MRIGSDDVEIYLRTASGDLFVFHEVFLSECYALASDVLENSRTIIDLGANVGLTTLFFAARAPQARFVCVEPDAVNASLLRDNVAALGDRATVVEAAIAPATGRVRFDSSAASWGGRITAAGNTEVNSLSMPALMDRYGISAIDILKVDIEGGEEELFAGCEPWIDAVRAIVIELHGSYNLEQLRNDVGPHGFDVYEPGASFGNRMVFAARREVSNGTQH
jgi:FkbM family methyltransferase